jgi:hypothetical protein
MRFFINKVRSKSFENLFEKILSPEARFVFRDASWGDIIVFFKRFLKAL